LKERVTPEQRLYRIKVSNLLSLEWVSKYRYVQKEEQVQTGTPPEKESRLNLLPWKGESG
jgi:hypothetical protein